MEQTPRSFRILRLPDVIERVGLSAPVIYKRIALGDFPAQLSLGPKASGWLESEIEAWIAKRIAERDARTAGEMNIGRKLAAAKQAKAERRTAEAAAKRRSARPKRARQTAAL